MSKHTCACGHDHDHHDSEELFLPCAGHPRVEYKANPIGMDESKPRFAYQLSGLSEQTARQIQVFEEGRETPVWDSGWVEDAHAVQIEYDGEPLKPFTRYTWHVRARGTDGTETPWSDDPKTLSDYSEKSFFETGFLGTPWEHSKWVGFWPGLRCCQTPQLFFQHFELAPQKQLKSARLYATAMGCYEAEVNGTVVSWPFTPGWTAYKQRVQYQAYDITELLKPTEKNTLWLTLASGWFDGHQAAGPFNYGISRYGKNELVRAEIRLVYTDGSIQTIGTTKDDTMTAQSGAEVRLSDIYDGEIYQAWFSREHTLALEAPEHARELAQPDVRIEWNSGAKVTKFQTRQPVEIIKRCPGTYIVDFGQNFAGRELLHLKNTVKGETITIKHGEMLNKDGSLYIENLRGAIAMTTYTCDDAKESTYEPSFTFYGFRYLEISGWFKPLMKKSIEAVVLSSDLPRTGAFQCDNELVNKLFDNAGWGLRSNLLDIPTDCPQRDERFGWTGDTQVVCNTATYCLTAGDFYTKWLTDFNLEQLPTGEYPFISPRPDCPEENPAFPWMELDPQYPGWTDAAVIVPWQIYRKYGDTRLLKKYFDQMDKYLQRIVESTKGTNIVEPNVFGDWLNLDDPTTLPFLGTAYLAEMLALLARIAKVIGRDADEKRISEQSADVKKSFRKRFLDEKTGLKETSQTACLIALNFDLLPKKWIKPTVETLKKNILAHDTHLTTGFLGTPMLLPVLAKYGEIDLAYELLCQKSYPGWLYPITQGATTMWERWNSYTKKNGFGPVDMNSFNHYAYGAVVEWFFETIGGITPIEDDPTATAFKRFRLAPQPGKKLNQAVAGFQSPYGFILSHWQRTMNVEGIRTIVWTFLVPENTTAEITLPGKLLAFSGACELQHDDNGNLVALPGSYEITMVDA